MERGQFGPKFQVPTIFFVRKLDRWAVYR